MNETIESLRECVDEAMHLHGKRLTKASLHRLRDALLLLATYRLRSCCFIAPKSNHLRKPSFAPLSIAG